MISGKIVLEEVFTFVAGKNKISINLFKTLAEGQFTVQLNTELKIYLLPFL